MKSKDGTFGVAILVVLVALIAACSGSGAKTTAGNGVSTSVGAGLAPTREIELMKTVPPVIARLTDSLRKGDLAASKDAYEIYDNTWNGIEVYVNFRSRDLYGQIETVLQAQVADGLKAPQPNFGELARTSEAMGKKYEEALALSAKGPPLSLLFDDLAALRIAREDLRTTSAALAAGDAAKAKRAFAAFEKGYAGVQGLMKLRSATAAKETDEAIAAVAAAIRANATAAEITLLVANATDRYNYGVRLLNAAARNADPAKTNFTESDLALLRGLNEIELQLKGSRAAWDSANYGGAAEMAGQALGLGFSRVQPALAAKSADADLENTLKMYAGLAVPGSDPGKVGAANLAALESTAVARQVLVGQFWLDPKLQAFLANLPQA